MKIQNLVAVAVIGLTASTAWAQSHPSAPGIASSTVGGIFVPAPATTTARTGGVTVSAPASTPVSVPTGTAALGPVTSSMPNYQAAANNVAAVTTGTPAAVATFTQTLASIPGVPAAAAQGIATALQQIGSSPSVGSVSAALTSWNSTLATLSPAQVRAVMSSPAGYAAMRTMLAAYRAAGRAR